MVCRPNKHEAFVHHAHEELGNFWGLIDLWFALNTILVVRDATLGSTICFSMFCVISSTSFINTPTLHLQPLPIMGLGYWCSLNFTSLV